MVNTTCVRANFETISSDEVARSGTKQNDNTDNDPLDRKTPTLLEFSSQFIEWIGGARLERDTQRYYRNGWKLLQTTALINQKLDRITPEAVEVLRFHGSPANANNALRTLRRMLNKAREWKLT